MTRISFLKSIPVLLVILIIRSSGYSGWNDEIRIGLSPTDSAYSHLLPLSFHEIKMEFVDFDGDGTQEIVVLGQDEADIKMGGDGEEYAVHEVFIFTQNPKTTQWEKAFFVKADTGLDSHRERIIEHSSFQRISLLNQNGAIAYQTHTPSAAGVCGGNVTVIYKRNNDFTSDTLEESFPLCLRSFRQKSEGILELTFDVFRVREDGTLIDAGCCPTGVPIIHQYRFQGSGFQKSHLE